MNRCFYYKGWELEFVSMYFGSHLIIPCAQGRQKMGEKDSNVFIIPLPKVFHYKPAF